jgi:accessory gene regulator B
MIGETLKLSPHRQNIVCYGLNVLLSNLLGIAVTLVIAYVLGIFSPTAAVVLTLLFLRTSAGGAHCSSSLNCSIFGYVFIPLLGYWAFWLSSVGAPIIHAIYLISCGLLALVGIALKAPYFTQSKPRAEARRKILKRRAFMFALIAALTSALFMANMKLQWSMGIATGLLFQAIMLLPFGIKGIQYLDNLLDRLLCKRR